MALFVHGQDVRAGGFVEPGLGFPLAALLELAQCGRVFLAPTARAAFLNADIVELPLIGQEDLGFDQMLAYGFVLVGEEFGEFDAAERVDAHLERRNALETPLGIG